MLNQDNAKKAQECETIETTKENKAFWPHDRQVGLQDRPRWPQDPPTWRPRSVMEPPKSLQDGSRTLQDGSKTLQDASKSLQEPPRWLQDASRPRKSSKIRPKWSQLAAKMCQKCIPNAIKMLSTWNTFQDVKTTRSNAIMMLLRRCQNIRGVAGELAAWRHQSGHPPGGAVFRCQPRPSRN